MHPKKRLLYIGNKLSKSGSTVTSIETLGVFLSKEGYEVFTSSSKKNKFLRILDMLSSVFKNRNRVDLVLIDTYSTQNFYYAVIVGKLCQKLQVPYIPILRGGDLPKRLVKSEKLSQNLFNNSFTNIAPSAYLLNKFQEAGYANLTYIPNTIPIENYRFLERSKPSAKLLWVRSFAEIYNPLLALEIVEGLMKDGVDVQLCMVGPDKDGSLERCKKIATEMKLPISFTGLLSKQEWISLSKEYDIFINTTNFDNMPVSVMEAMALGIPVVSTNVGGLPYMIEDGVNGILLPPNNAQSFVKVITTLINTPDKSLSIARNARVEIEKMDWGVVRGMWDEVLMGEEGN